MSPMFIDVIVEKGMAGNMGTEMKSKEEVDQAAKDAQDKKKKEEAGADAKGGSFNDAHPRESDGKFADKADTPTSLIKDTQGQSSDEFLDLGKGGSVFPPRPDYNDIQKEPVVENKVMDAIKGCKPNDVFGKPVNKAEMGKCRSCGQRFYAKT